MPSQGYWGTGKKEGQLYNVEEQGTLFFIILFCLFICLFILLFFLLGGGGAGAGAGKNKNTFN